MARKTDDEDDDEDPFDIDYKGDDDGDDNVGDGDSDLDDVAGDENDEEEEGEDSNIIAEHDAEVDQLARESMFATGIMNMAETLGCKTHEVVHALATCMAGIVNFASKQVSIHERDTGTIWTNEQRMENFTAEVLEKVEIARKAEAKNAERTDKASVRSGRATKRGTH